MSWVYSTLSSIRIESRRRKLIDGLSIVIVREVSAITEKLLITIDVRETPYRKASSLVLPL